MGGDVEEENLEYYRHRAQTERRLASDASRADVAAIHIELAGQYEGLVEQAQLRQAVESQPIMRCAT